MFGFGGKKFIGIDIGTSAIKIVELKIESNKPVLANYAWMRIDGLAGINDVSAGYFENILPGQLKRIFKEAKFKGKDVYLSIPAFGGLITLIEFPEMSKEDLDQAIRFEAHKYIPVPLEDIVLSWDVVSRKNPDGIALKGGAAVDDDKEKIESGTTQVLLVAAQKNQVSKYEKLVKTSGLNLKSIEIESFSLVRSLVGNDQGNFIIVDIGSRVCNIMLVEKGVIKVNRNIDAGGRDITKMISKSMGVDEDRADKLKVSGKNFMETDSNINFPVVDAIIREISRVIKSHYENVSQTAIDGIILSGGTAGLTGIEEYFSKNLNIRTVAGNPFGRVGYDKRLEPAIRLIGNQFSVAIGLALGGVNDHLKK
jgi:type IV pilus assembly protein PilM